MFLNHRDHRASRSALLDNFDSIEEGGLRASSSYSHGISDHDNEGAMGSLQDKVSFLKRVSVLLIIYFLFTFYSLQFFK